MPNVRKPRQWDANKAALVCEKLCDGESLAIALKTVDWTFADHFRLIGEQKPYETMIAHALKDRSRQLLERTLEIEQQLSELDNSASSTDVNAARVRADILKSVALAYDKSLSPSSTQEVEEHLGLVDLLKRMESEEEGKGQNKQPVDKLIADEPLSPITQDSKLTH